MKIRSYSLSCTIRTQFKLKVFESFIYFYILPTLIKYLSLVWTSPAGYHPELGINSCSWVINSSCWGEGGCRVEIEPGLAVQQPDALTTELRRTPIGTLSRASSLSLVFTFWTRALYCTLWTSQQPRLAEYSRSHHRHLLRDRRLGPTACPACWPVGTNESVRGEEKNILYWATTM